MAGATPNKQEIKILEETHEIISLAGTLTGDDCHLHIGGNGTFRGGFQNVLRGGFCSGIGFV
jgi:predicted DNA-binding protein with PD1-like motif